MPSGILESESGMPNLNKYQSADEKINAIQSYLFMLIEQLRWSLRNLGAENFNEVDLQKITEPIYARIKGADDAIAELIVTGEEIAARVDGKVDGADVTSMISTAIGTITLAVGSDSGGSYIQIKRDGIAISGSKIHVDGKFEASSIKAENIEGGIIDISKKAYFLVPAEDEYGDYVYDDDGDLVYTNAGYISSSDSGGVEIYSKKGAGLKSKYGSQVIAGESGVSLRDADSNNIRFYDGDFYPAQSYSYLGISSNPWRGVYADTGEILTSDRKKKTDISYDNDKYSAFFDNLKPCNYKMVNGTSGRTHTGFISQDVEESLNDCGIDSKEFAGFIRDKENDTYALRYEEFISLCVDQIQRLKKRVDELEQKGGGTDAT